MQCETEKNCFLHYDRNYTPLLLDTTPSNVYYGQMVQYNVNVKQAHATMERNKVPITAIKIGKTNLDYESTITGTTRLPGW